jgi:uncharacterized protein
MYQASVPVFVQFLTSLSGLLDEADGTTRAKNLDAAVLPNARLAPDMYPLHRQVGEAIRHVVQACTLLTDVAAPPSLETEPDIAVLKARIEATLTFLNSLQPAQFEGTEGKDVIFTFRSGATRAFTGRSLLLTFSMPQFFFHVTTAYDILRHSGLDLKKKHFLGQPPAHAS